MKRIAIIPARSGSKGLKDKNIKMLCGKPLISYSIECAIQSGKFDKVFVSTDSQTYADIATEYGADASFLRSEETSTDSAGSWDVVREVIQKFESLGEHFDEIALLQATSPLRLPEDITNAFSLFYEKNANAVVSLTECDHSPLQCNTLPADGNMDQFDKTDYKDLPRQALPTFYRYNGAIYIIKTAELEKDDMFAEGCYAYIMPQERSIDIDTALDFMIAEIMMRKENSLNG